MPFDPTTGMRLETGGRLKGTLNKPALAVKEAIARVYAELQSEAGREDGQ